MSKTVLTRAWATSLIVTIFVTHSYLLVAGTPDNDHPLWPSLYYHMFSKPQVSWSAKKIKLVGQPESDAGREIDLLKLEYFDPIRPSSIQRVLVSKGGSLGNEIVKVAWRQYEYRRINGLHSGPKLNRIRLYWGHWRLDPNLPHGGALIGQELIAEIDSEGATN